MALLTHTIAISAGAAMHGEPKHLDKWVRTLLGQNAKGPGQASSDAQPDLTAFIRQLEAAGKVKVTRGPNRR